MDTRKIVIESCKKYGAREVYNAAYKRAAGDRLALSKVGIQDVATIAQADAIGQIAFGMMSKNETSKDLADITIEHAKKHGLHGNKNAAKGIKKESYIHVRCDQEDKAGWVKTAHSEGMKLSEWITLVLNNTSRF